jgi:Putative prokaryotic signal transducing protein
VLNPQQLRQRYAEMDDAALIALVQNEGLIQNAHEIAVNELSSRGISLASKQSSVEVEIEFGQNEEMDLDNQAMDSLTEVARFSAPIDGHMLEARLHAEGIPAWAMNANTAQALNHLTLALGGVQVLVPSHLLADAQNVMRRLEAGEFALDDDYEESN